MKPDDSSLDPADLVVVEGRAKRFLDRADAWGVFPTPVDTLMEAAKLQVAPKSAFDPSVFLAYIKQKTQQAAETLKRAIGKVFGLYDSTEGVVHIDYGVGSAKQTFLKLHEAGHHEMPTHKTVFKLFQECEQTLAPEIADRFEREANNFARFVLFQGDTFRKAAADHKMGIRTPIDLAKRFGSSNYAAAREFARTHHAPCVVYVLNPLVPGDAGGFKAEVRRIEPSPSFLMKFGRPTDLVIDHKHPLASLIPIGKKRMTPPRDFVYVDRNGIKHQCIGEGFDTKHNILLLIYPEAELPTSLLFLPK
ncbi:MULTISPECIES: ImmA/IrrE family metallo-endopeptidase [Stenotrophomonas]|uniref:ImmA/IrrE family metallo-endopeptidase n=1 Tax=Stenotrophomonas TaxID=40323 RepID=UPI000DA9373A|nr:MULTISPECIES: ImmA/IrrE family metallo-endopeptidase [Stenotrophomonas]MBE5270591.1 ImmA/IrrE family metallo-endopeptidase [Stenotrophomonas sp. B2]PZS47370.1 hypothetical protein A7X60_00240 [Stenotrophomonas maltophilia]